MPADGATAASATVGGGTDRPAGGTLDTPGATPKAGNRVPVTTGFSVFGQSPQVNMRGYRFLPMLVRTLSTGPTRTLPTLSTPLSTGWGLLMLTTGGCGS
jgi:hypothetical protein